MGFYLIFIIQMAFSLRQLVTLKVSKLLTLLNMDQSVEEKNLLKSSRLKVAMSWLRMAVFESINYKAILPKPKCQLLSSKDCLKPFQVIDNKEFQQMIWKPGQFDQ